MSSSYSSRQLRTITPPLVLLTIVFFYFNPSLLFPSSFYSPSSTSYSSSHSSDSPYGIHSAAYSKSDYQPAPASIGPPTFPDIIDALQDHRQFSDRNYRDLVACLARGNCGKNQEKVVLVTGGWFRDALVSLGGTSCMLAGR
jgi:hypothetical protein